MLAEWLDGFLTYGPKVADVRPFCEKRALLPIQIGRTRPTAQAGPQISRDGQCRGYLLHHGGKQFDCVFVDSFGVVLGM